MSGVSHTCKLTHSFGVLTNRCTHTLGSFDQQGHENGPRLPSGGITRLLTGISTNILIYLTSWYICLKWKEFSLLPYLSRRPTLQRNTPPKATSSPKMTEAQIHLIDTVTHKPNISKLHVLFTHIFQDIDEYIKLQCRPVLLPAVGSLARVLSKALVTDWNKFIFVVGPTRSWKNFIERLKSTNRN